MTIIESLRWVLADLGRSNVVCECRRCGTTVSPRTDRCPECDVDDIVRYSISG